MPYIPVPKDLTKVKSKVLFNLTKRQLVCFGGGALVGVPLFFLLKEPLGNSLGGYLHDCRHDAVLSLFALYEKNGSAAGEVPAVPHSDVLLASQAAALHDEQPVCGP